MRPNTAYPQLLYTGFAFRFAATNRSGLRKYALPGIKMVRGPTVPGHEMGLLANEARTERKEVFALPSEAGREVNTPPQVAEPCAAWQGGAGLAPR